MKEKLIYKKFINTQQKPQIFINTLMLNKKKYNFLMSKFVSILFILIFNQY